MDFIKKTLFRATVIFTVIVSVFSLVIMLIYSGNEEGANLSALRVFLILPFSLLLGAAETVRRDTKLSAPLKLLIHALLTVPSAYLLLVLPADSDSGAKSSDRFMHFIFTALIYAVAVLAVFLIGKAVRKTVEEDRKYRK